MSRDMITLLPPLKSLYVGQLKKIVTKKVRAGCVPKDAHHTRLVKGQRPLFFSSDAPPGLKCYGKAPPWRRRARLIFSTSPRLLRKRLSRLAELFFAAARCAAFRGSLFDGPLDLGSGSLPKRPIILLSGDSGLPI